MSKRTGLGRGLGAFFGNDYENAEAGKSSAKPSDEAGKKTSVRETEQEIEKKSLEELDMVLPGSKKQKKSASAGKTFLSIIARLNVFNIFFKSIFFQNPDNHYHRLSRCFVFRPIRALFLCWSLKTHRKVRQPQHQLLIKRFCCIWQACHKNHTCHKHRRYFLSSFYHCLPPFFFRCYPNYYMLCKSCFW